MSSPDNKISVNYINSQFDRLIIDNNPHEFKHSVILHGCHGGSTNCLSISDEQLKAIKLILLEGSDRI